LVRTNKCLPAMCCLAKAPHRPVDGALCRQTKKMLLLFRDHPFPSLISLLVNGSMPIPSRIERLEFCSRPGGASFALFFVDMYTTVLGGAAADPSICCRVRRHFALLHCGLMVGIGTRSGAALGNVFGGVLLEPRPTSRLPWL
jgi:hypothetical protein